MFSLDPGQSHSLFFDDVRFAYSLVTANVQANGDVYAMATALDNIPLPAPVLLLGGSVVFLPLLRGSRKRRAAA